MGKSYRKSDACLDIGNGKIKYYVYEEMVNVIGEFPSPFVEYVVIHDNDAGKQSSSNRTLIANLHYSTYL